MAARDEQQVAIDRATIGRVTGGVEPGDLDPGHMPAAARAEHARTGRDRDAGLAQALLPAVGWRGRGVRTQVDDLDHRRACRLHLEGDAIGAVADRGEHHAAARQHRVFFQVAQRGAGEHHARTIVAREHERLFDGSGREHHLLRAHLPEALARETGRRVGEVVGDALAEAEMVVREVAEGGGARQQPHPGVTTEFVDRRRDPLGRRDAVDARPGVGQQRTAHLRPLIAEDHARAAARRGQRRRETGGTCAHDEHLAMRVLLRVAVGVGQARRLAQARHAADQRLVEPMPGAARPHEGLVVEARGQERREQFRHTPEVETQARPAVLADGAEAVVELHLGRAQVGRRARGVAAHGDEGRGLLGACGHDAARPVVLERATDEVHAVGEQRRGEGVALQPFVGLAVKGEAERTVAADAAARRQARDAHRGVSAAPVADTPGGFSPAL